MTAMNVTGPPGEEMDKSSCAISFYETARCFVLLLIGGPMASMHVMESMHVIGPPGEEMDKSSCAISFYEGTKILT